MPSPGGPVTAVFLDAGGVLTRLRSPRPEIFRVACASRGLAMSRERAEAFFGEIRRCVEEDADLLLEDYPRWQEQALAQAVARADLGDDRLEGTWAAYRRLLQDPRYRVLYADAKPALKALRRRGYRLGVISNASVELVPLLHRYGVAASFETIVASEALGVDKPQREIFQQALDDLGVLPVEALHAGDHLHFDFLGARRAGLHAVLVDRGGTSPPAVPRIATLGELPSFLDRQGL